MHIHGEKPLKRYILVLGLSITYMVAEIVGGILSGSLALIADSAHMAIDTFAILLSLFAVWISRLPATSEKTFGYYRAEILAAAVNAASLLLVSVWIFYQAWHRSQMPHEVQGPLMTWVAAGGLLVNVVGLFLLGHSKTDLNRRGVWLHLLNDALGSFSAVLGGVLVWRYGLNGADLWVSIFIATLILYGAWNLLKEAVNILLDGVPEGIKLPQIKSSLEQLQGVKSVHDLHVWTVASGVPSLSAHVCIGERVDPAALLNEITRVLKERFQIEHITVQLEPSSFRHGGKGPCNLSH